MSTKFKALVILILAGGCLAIGLEFALARGGGHAGGGGRPSMAHVGGGGGRPSGGMSAQRPAAHPQVSRPNNGPSMAHAARPTTPSRPNVAQGGGHFEPSGGGRPSFNGSTARPGGSAIANRPAIHSPSNVGPTTRPALPGGGMANHDRPSFNDRPGAGGEHAGAGNGRPSFADLNPGGGGVRPGSNGGGIYHGGDRPNGGGDRPHGGGLRPGDGGLRPGDGGHRPDRPIIGGGGDHSRNPFINNGNINIGNHVNIGGGNVIGNRPNWDRSNWNRPDWGWGGGGRGWASNWDHHCINNHYTWYNGCWNGHWGSNWYAPLAWGAVGWGLGTLTSGWGYGTSYYNPYVVEQPAAVVAPYDYSQPVVVNNYVASDSDPGGPTAEASNDPPGTQQALQLFDQGQALFKSADYQAALGKFDAGLKQLPGDPVLHEVRALTLFALGDYQQAAAALNSFLSSAPGMDWTTLSSLYGNVDDYQTQLRKLEQYCKANPHDAAAYFVLAYQYLVIDAKDAAIKALQVVVMDQPKDSTAKRMLDALSPQPAPAVATAETTPGTALPGSGTSATNTTAANAPQTDLVGNWQANAAGTTINLSIGDDSHFNWKATQAGKPPITLAGQLETTGDEISLDSKDKGAMSGSVKSLGSDSWQFALSGAPTSDPGLTFTRLSN